jgi:TM2 domain-containing membrane protein YozV
MSTQDAIAKLDVSTAMRYDANKKSPFIAYLLWFFLGGLGGHRFYAGRTGSAIALLLLSLFSVPLTAVGIGLIGVVMVGIWVLIDAFLIPDMIRTHNNGLLDLLTAKQVAA